MFNGFTATITDASGLQDGDLAIINATTTPEPGTWILLGTGVLFIGIAQMGRRRWTGKVLSGTALGLGVALLLLPGKANAQDAVKLNAVTSPSSGSAGTSTVSVTGTGFPSGSISAAAVTVSLSATCGGSPTTAAASTVQTVIGTSDKVGFIIPSSLAAATYYVSVSANSAGGVGLTSS